MPEFGRGDHGSKLEHTPGGMASTKKDIQLHLPVAGFLYGFLYDMLPIAP